MCFSFALVSIITQISHLPLNGEVAFRHLLSFLLLLEKKCTNIPAGSRLRNMRNFQFTPVGPVFCFANSPGVILCTLLLSLQLYARIE